MQFGSRSCTFSSLQDSYLMIYFDVADSINGEIQKWFNQEIFYLYAKWGKLLVSAVSRVCAITENLEVVKKHFGDYLNASRWFNLLAVLSAAVSGVSVKMKDVLSSTLAFTSNCSIFSEVRKLLQLMYMLPVTIASFSSLRLLKMYPRTTMSVQRLNHI